MKKLRLFAVEQSIEANSFFFPHQVLARFKFHIFMFFLNSRARDLCTYRHKRNVWMRAPAVREEPGVNSPQRDT